MYSRGLLRGMVEKPCLSLDSCRWGTLDPSKLADFAKLSHFRLVEKQGDGEPGGTNHQGRISGSYFTSGPIGCDVYH